MKLLFLLLGSIFGLGGAQCPGGFTRMESNTNKCYKYIHATAVTPDAAFQACSNLGANVISIGSVAENNELNSVIMNCNGDTENCGSAWIGLLYDNATLDYSWSDGVSVTYTNIDHSTSYCNDGFFGEHFFMSWNKMWYNCPFSSYNGKIHGVLCEQWITKPPPATTTTKQITTTTSSTPSSTTTTTKRPTTTTSSTAAPTPAGNCPSGWYQSIINSRNCYLFVSDAKDWNTANFQCFAVDQRASLASIDSGFENTEIINTAMKMAPRCNDFFIGLHQDNQYSPWTWINGDTSGYRNWRSGFPSYSYTSGNGPNANCGRLGMSDGKYINDVCTKHSHCYICELTL